MFAYTHINVCCAGKTGKRKKVCCLHHSLSIPDRQLSFLCCRVVNQLMVWHKLKLDHSHSATLFFFSHSRSLTRSTVFASGWMPNSLCYTHRFNSMTGTTSVMTSFNEFFPYFQSGKVSLFFVLSICRLGFIWIQMRWNWIWQFMLEGYKLFPHEIAEDVCTRWRREIT